MKAASSDAMSRVKFTNIPQWIVDECLSKRDAAFHTLDTIAVFLDVKQNSIILKIEKLNSTEMYTYTLS